MLILPFAVSARGLVPCGGAGEKPCTVQDTFYLIATVTNWLLMVVGIFAVYSIAIRSFFLVISDGDEEKITTQRKAIMNAVIGFCLALFAYLLVNTAANYLLQSKCLINLRDPLTYLRTMDPSQCTPNPLNKNLK